MTPEPPEIFPSPKDAVATGIIGGLFRGFLFNVILKLKGWNPKTDVSFSAPGNRFLGSVCSVL